MSFFTGRTTKYLKTCLGLNKVNRLCYASDYETLLAIERQGDLNPIQRSQLENLKRTQGSTGSGGSFEDIIKRTIALQQEANKPAIQSLQASIPELNQQYTGAIQRAEGQRKPLEDRYKNLIDEIKGNQVSSENRQTVTTRNELGRRGLVGGGLYDQTLTDAVNPITQQYSGLLKDTGIAQEQGIQGINELIAQLTGQQTNATRGVQNSIAQLQSGAAQAGISGGQQQYQFEQQQAFQKQQAEEAARQRAIENALAQAQASAKSPYLTLSEGQTVYDPSSMAALYTAPKTYKGTGGSNLPSLQSIFGM